MFGWVEHQALDQPISYLVAVASDDEDFAGSYSSVAGAYTRSPTIRVSTDPASGSASSDALASRADRAAGRPPAAELSTSGFASVRVVRYSASRLLALWTTHTSIWRSWAPVRVIRWSTRTSRDKRIAIIEAGTFGGTCLNVGCIPTKMYVYAAEVANTIRHSSKYGVDASLDRVRWLDIRDRIFGRIDPISEGGKQYRQDGPNTTVFFGHAEFTGERALSISTGDQHHRRADRAGHRGSSVHPRLSSPLPGCRSTPPTRSCGSSSCRPGC